MYDTSNNQMVIKFWNIGFGDFNDFRYCLYL